MGKSVGTLCLVLGFAVAHPALAELRFERERVELPPAAVSVEAVTAMFPFTNTGDAPVTIASLTSSCGCTVATMGKRTYGSGERGEVVATFTFGNRVGPQVKHVVVKTAGEEPQEVVLTLTVTIPAILDVRPRSLAWAPGESSRSKKVRIRVIHDEPLRVLLAPPKPAPREEGRAGGAARTDDAPTPAAGNEGDGRSVLATAEPLSKMAAAPAASEPPGAGVGGGFRGASTFAVLCTQHRWARVFGKACGSAIQKPGAPSPVASSGSIVRPRRFTSKSSVFHDCSHSR